MATYNVTYEMAQEYYKEMSKMDGGKYYSASLCNNCSKLTNRSYFDLWDILSCSEECDKEIKDKIQKTYAKMFPEGSK